MPESQEERMAQLEEMKRANNFDERIQHLYWTQYGEYVPLAQIQSGPDLVMTFMGSEINEAFASMLPLPAVPKEGSRGRKKKA